MGQADSKKKIQQQFEIYRIQKDGNALLKSKKDSKQYLMRIATCTSHNDLSRLKALLECRAQLKNHHILSLVEIKQKQQDYLCSIHYKMYLVLEYSFKNLTQEIKQRALTNEKNYFQESDIWSILYSCCSALNALYSNGATHESLTSDQIFINKDGFVKIAEPLLFGLQKNHLQALRTKDDKIINVHLSPEIISCLDDQNFFYYDKQKSDIFVLAMIVVDAALLSNHYLYDPVSNKPLFEEIQKLLIEVGKRFSNNLVNVLRQMLKIQSRMRPSLCDIIEKIEKFNNVEEFTVQTQSNMKSNEITSQRVPQRIVYEKIISKEELEEIKKKTQPIVPIIYVGGTLQQQSLSIKQPIITFNQQNFDGRIFTGTSQQSIYQNPTFIYPSYQVQPQRIMQVVHQNTIPIPIQPNFDLFERSRSIDSIKITSNEYSQVDQTKNLPVNVAKPLNPLPQIPTETKRIVIESPVKSSKPIFTHQIPEVYNILMSSKAGFKNESLKNTERQSFLNRENTQARQLRREETPKSHKFANLKNIPYETVSRTGDEPELPPFQPIELRKHISRTQSEKQRSTSCFKKEFQPQTPNQPIMNTYHAVQGSAFKPNLFAGSNPSPSNFVPTNIPFANSAVGKYGLVSSSPIVSSSFIPSFPSPIFKGESFTCRSGFSHLALFHNNDEDLKLEHVKQQVPEKGIYEGYKCNNMKNGHGILYFKDGGHYEGEWKDDKMHGFGKLYYENGKIAYEGHWDNDEFNGQGRVYNSQPVIFDQQFNYKDFSELGNKWTYYQGQFKNDSKHGKGYIKLTNGEMFEGIFDHDMIQGNGIFYKRKGEIVIGFWIDNKLFLNQSYQHDKK